MTQNVPDGLRRWFVIHFLVDIAFAIPLFAAPQFTLGLFGWECVDPVATRMVAGALFGIGIESYLMRKADAPVFRAMLSLKVIWSGAAVVGLLTSLIQGAPPMAWIIFGIFAVFCVIWSRYLILLRSSAEATA